MTPTATATIEEPSVTVTPSDTPTATEEPTTPTPTATATATPEEGEITISCAVCDAEAWSLRDPIIILFSDSVMTDTIEITLSPEVEFESIWDELGTSVTLLCDNLEPVEPYQLSVQGGEGMAGEFILPLECAFVTSRMALHLPLLVRSMP